MRVRRRARTDAVRHDLQLTGTKKAMNRKAWELAQSGGGDTACRGWTDHGSGVRPRRRGGDFLAIDIVHALMQRYRPTQPHVGGPLLAALIYALAFSPWGAQCRPARSLMSRRDRQPTRCCTGAALSFSLTQAYLYSKLENWPRQGTLHPRVGN